MFEALTDQWLVRSVELYFRAGLADRHREDHPDIVIKGETKAGDWWLIIEAKVQSGEGERQSERYGSACRRACDRGEIAGYSLVYLTLSGEESEMPEWRPMTHYDLASMISRCDIDQVLMHDAVLAAPWLAYLARLQHHRDYPRPSDGDALLPWLLNDANSAYFVTQGERASMLGPAFAIPGYKVRSFALTRQGRSQFLLQAWKPHWMTGKWDADELSPLEECVFVHFELDVMLPFKGNGATCHLHCESNPYKTQAQLRKLGNWATRFTEFVECFSRELHERIPLGKWTPSNYPLQKARSTCPFKPEITISELRTAVLPLLAQLEDAVDTAMLEAGRFCGLGWASTFKSHVQVT